MATKSFLDLTGLEQVKEKIFSTVDEKLKNIKAVKYDEQQELTDAEKLQARQNIGAEGYDWHEVTDPNLMSYTIANVPGVYGIADWDIFELTIYPDDTEFRAFSILLNNLRSLFNYNNRNRLLTKASSVKNLLFTLIDAGAFDSSKHEYQFYRKLDNIIHYRLRYNTDAKSITINSSESDDSSCTYGSGQIIYNYEDNSIVSSDINYPSCYSVLAGDPTAADTYTPSTDANLTTKKYIDDLHLVSYSAQTLTDEQKLQARENIGAEGYNWHSVIGYYNMVYTLSNIPGTEGILDWDIFENTVFTDADGEEWKIFPSMISEFDFIFDYANKDYIIDSLTNTTNYFFDLRDAGAFDSSKHEYQFCRKLSDGSINFYNFHLNSSSKSITFSHYTIGGNNPSSGQVIFYYETKEIYTGSSTYINYEPRYYVLNNFTKSDAGKFLNVDDNGDVIAKDIPEQSQSDWDQNDSTALDYIKNRTHYTERETITTVLVDEQEISFSNGETVIENVNTGVNTTLIFNYDSEEYTVTTFALDDGGMTLYVFGCTISSDGEPIPDDNLPFWGYCVEDSDQYFLIIVSKTSEESHTIGITKIEDNEIVHQLDEKYIPDTIARTKSLSSNLRLTEFTMIDEITGLEYIIKMSNGKIIYMSLCTGISVEQSNNVTYVFGGDFYIDKDCVAVIATCEDGSTREVTNYTYTGDTSTVDSGYVIAEITYTEKGNVFTTTANIEIEMLDLQDFTYTNNGDGTYTITGWNGTLNGASSTEIVLPDNPIIIL